MISYFYISVVGCPHPKAPRSAWVERKGDRAIVRCNHTTETWYLTCRGNSWVGQVSNCTKGKLLDVYYPLMVTVVGFTAILSEHRIYSYNSLLCPSMYSLCVYFLDWKLAPPTSFLGKTPPASHWMLPQIM